MEQKQGRVLVAPQLKRRTTLIDKNGNVLNQTVVEPGENPIAKKFQERLRRMKRGGL